MFFVAVVVFPVVLLLLLLVMERVERPLRRDPVSAELARFLDSPSLEVEPEEPKVAVADYPGTVERIRRRRRFALTRRFRAGVR